MELLTPDQWLVELTGHKLAERPQSEPMQELEIERVDLYDLPAEDLMAVASVRFLTEHLSGYHSYGEHAFLNQVDEEKIHVGLVNLTKQSAATIIRALMESHEAVMRARHSEEKRNAELLEQMKEDVKRGRSSS